MTSPAATLSAASFPAPAPTAPSSGRPGLTIAAAIRATLFAALALGHLLPPSPALGATTEKGDTKKKGKLADADVEDRLGLLIKAYNDQDVDRVLTFYADSAYVRFLTFVPHTSDGKGQLVELASEFRDEVCTFEVKLTERARVWKRDDRVWTLQPFELTYTPKNGDPVYWKGRHSAIWEKRKRKKQPQEANRPVLPMDRYKKDEGEWLIIQERLVERDTRANPFERHLEGQKPGMSVVEAPPTPVPAEPAGAERPAMPADTKGQ